MYLCFWQCFGGGYLFTTIYNDDLTAKTLPAIIGFGNKRTTIVISKIIISIVMSIATFLAASVVFFLIFTILGFKIDGNMSEVLFKILLLNLLKLIAFSIISSVVVYGTQKATFSIVTFVLLITSFISQMLFLCLDKMKDMIDLTKYTLLPIVGEFVLNTTFLTFIPYFIYIAIFIVLSIVAFSKKDLEF